jgi:predicted Zn-dependent protease
MNPSRPTSRAAGARDPLSRASRAWRAAAAALLPCAAACNLALIPDDTMNALGAEAYVEATKEYREITGTPEAEMVARVGQKIAAVSGKGYDWEFKLLDAPDVVNAFCLPGGKIAVFTGILPITQNEDGLAVVIGHEVAHATEAHGNKRMTQNIFLEGAMTVTNAAITNWGEVDGETQGLIMQALGAGAQFGLVLPYSRDHESEADIVGLRYVVRAGYDPYEAPKLWERMASAFPDEGPEWMRTHPHSSSRAEALRAMIPQIEQEERSKAAPVGGQQPSP